MPLTLAGQTVGVAIGAQDSINWKGVALGAVSAGVTAGLGAAGLMPNAENAFVRGALGGAVRSTVTQGIAVATGLQKSFNWKGVAASALSGGVAQGLNDAMGYNPMGGQFDLGKSLVSGLGGSIVGNAARGGKLSATSIAADAFANVIGDSLAAAHSSEGTYVSQEERLRDQFWEQSLGPVASRTPSIWQSSMSESDANWLLGDMGSPSTQQRYPGTQYADASDVLRSGVLSDAGTGVSRSRVEVSGSYWEQDHQLSDGTWVQRPSAAYADSDNSRKIFDLPAGSTPPSIPGYSVYGVDSSPQLNTQDVVYLPAPVYAGPALENAAESASAGSFDAELVDRQIQSGKYDAFSAIGGALSAGRLGDAWRYATYTPSAQAQAAAVARVYPPPTVEAQRLSTMTTSPVGSIAWGIAGLTGASPRTQDAVLRTVAAAGELAGAVTGTYKQTLTAQAPSPFSAAATSRPKSLGASLLSPGTLRFEPAGYHGTVDNAIKSRGPVNGQSALDASVQVKDTSPRRIGIDYQTGDFVVFDRTLNDIYHGHVRSWTDLHPDMQRALRQANMVDGRGNILKDR